MKTINLIELQMLIKPKLENKIKQDENNYILIDVREQYEIERYGKIPTSINIPLDDLERVFESEIYLKKILGSVPDKKIKIILYCMSGGRSFIATQYLASLGYNAINFKGSMLEWKKMNK